MIPELKEVTDLVNRRDTYRPGKGIPEPPSEEEITRCIQVMMAHQCIYPHQHNLKSVYRILSYLEYQEFFRKYFRAMGLELFHDTRSGMIALKVISEMTRHPSWSIRLKKDETHVLLALRLIYDEIFADGQQGERGEVETTTDDLVDKLVVIGNVQIAEARLLEILTAYEKKGITALGDRDPVDRVRVLMIYPGVEVVTPQGNYIQYVQDVAAKMTAIANEKAASEIPQIDNSDAVPFDEQGEA